MSSILVFHAKVQIRMMPHNIIIVLNYHIFVILIKFFRLFTQMHVDMFFSMLQDNPTIDILIHFFVDILHENCTFVFSQNLGKVELSMRALHIISNFHMIYEMGRKLFLQTIHSRVSNSMQTQRTHITRILETYNNYS